MATLICMRLANMKRIHPKMTTDQVCSKCGEALGVYPSGQRALAAMPDLVLMCEVCQPPGPGVVLAPGAELDAMESHRRE
jgi:hypothetical protein